MGSLYIHIHQGENTDNNVNGYSQWFLLNLHIVRWELSTSGSMVTVIQTLRWIAGEFRLEWLFQVLNSLVQVPDPLNLK